LVIIRFNKDDKEQNTNHYISIKDFYAKSDEKIAEIQDAIPFPDDISSIIVAFVMPVQYTGIYALQETEWRSDITMSVTGLSFCYMFPDYRYIMRLSLQSTTLSSSYYAVIRGTWTLRTDQENFREWSDPLQVYIDALCPRKADEKPSNVESMEYVGGFVSFQMKKGDKNEHPNAFQQFMMNSRKSHYQKADANHILFEIDEIKQLEKPDVDDKDLPKFENEAERDEYAKKLIKETNSRLREMEWKEANTNGGEKKIIDWNCNQLDFVNANEGLRSRCGGGCFGPRNPNWCENPVYEVMRQFWRRGIHGSNTGKSYWETDEDVDEKNEIPFQ